MDDGDIGGAANDLDQAAARQRHPKVGALAEVIPIIIARASPPGGYNGVGRARLRP